VWWDIVFKLLFVISKAGGGGCHVETNVVRNHLQVVSNLHAEEAGVEYKRKIDSNAKEKNRGANNRMRRADHVTVLSFRGKGCALGQEADYLRYTTATAKTTGSINFQRGGGGKKDQKAGRTGAAFTW